MLTVLLLAGLACHSVDADTSATQVQAPSPGVVAVSPTSINFGQLYLGDELSNTFTIANQGQGDLTVYDVQFDDDSLRPHWSLQGGLSGTLGPGESTDITVMAHPIAITDVSARLRVVCDDPDNPSVSVILQAQVVGTPELRLDPATVLELGDVAVDESVDGDVHIANDGTADLIIQSVRLGDGGGPFSIVTDATGATIRPHSEDGLVSVRFSPTERGAFADTVVITTSDPVAPSVSLAVTGIGIEADR